MSIPGYGAEASIYRSTGRYHTALTAGMAPPGGVAVPQQAFNPCWGLEWCQLLWCECRMAGGIWRYKGPPWIYECGGICIHP